MLFPLECVSKKGIDVGINNVAVFFNDMHIYFLDFYIRKVMEMVAFDLSIILIFLLLHYVIFISIFVLVTSLRD